ncbi:type IV pilin protein [Pontibacterium sp. N1Y112]|uniref:Type IV pilin protein n=2 Tax=Pontibacterium sinense TaxID=2781979 RepID=A0A8J7FCQ9_9GAMM|nr:type IV pilin protein [Pontibacterium sinense]
MITVAIIGIIAAIAYPSYTDYVQQARRADGQGAMLQAAQWMERQFTVNGNYNSDFNSVDGDGNAIKPYDTDFYSIVVSGSTTSTYTIQGTPTGAQASDDCKILSVTSVGVKSAKESDGTAIDGCWD